MDRRDFTETEADAFLATALINARDASLGVLRTGVVDANMLQSMNYTAFDVLSMATQTTLTANRETMERHPSSRLPTRADYQLAGEACPLTTTFRTAWQRFERSR
jgi:hypothetical protein